MPQDIAEAELVSAWNPRPADNVRPRKDYYSGYSDGFHQYPFGAGHDQPNDAYRSGFSDGRNDDPRNRRDIGQDMMPDGHDQADVGSLGNGLRPR